MKAWGAMPTLRMAGLEPRRSEARDPADSAGKSATAVAARDRPLDDGDDPPFRAQGESRPGE